MVRVCVILQIFYIATRMALSRAHSSATDTDVAKLLLLNKYRHTCTMLSILHVCLGPHLTVTIMIWIITKI